MIIINSVTAVLHKIVEDMNEELANSAGDWRLVLKNYVEFDSITNEQFQAVVGNKPQNTIMVLYKVASSSPSKATLDWKHERARVEVMLDVLTYDSGSSNILDKDKVECLVGCLQKALETLPSVRKNYSLLPEVYRSRLPGAQVQLDFTLTASSARDQTVNNNNYKVINLQNSYQIDVTYKD